MAQSVRASERTTVVVGSNPTQLSRATSKNPSVVNTICISGEYHTYQWWIPYVSVVNTICISGEYHMYQWWIPYVSVVKTICISGEYYMYQWWIPYVSALCPTLYDYLKKISIKINVATSERNNGNEIWHWAWDKIRVSVQCWLWVLV